MGSLGPRSPLFREGACGNTSLLLQPDTRLMAYEVFRALPRVFIVIDCLQESPPNVVSSSRTLVDKYSRSFGRFNNTTPDSSWGSEPAKLSHRAVSDSVPKGGLRTHRLKRILPMFLNGSHYDTTPDTGSRENAISAHEARRMELNVRGRRRHFLMGKPSTHVMNQ